MLTNQEVLAIALQQSAYDCNCASEDFLNVRNVVHISQAHPLARKYLNYPISCDLVSYGTNIVAQASEVLVPVVKQYIDRYPWSIVLKRPIFMFWTSCSIPSDRRSALWQSISCRM